MIIRKEVAKLPIGNYNIHFDKDKEEYYVAETESFTLPENIYGNYQEDIDLYLKSFNSNSKNMGLMLTGEKGAGKTLMAKDLMIQSKLPILLVNECFTGNKFIEFINNINQEVIVFFDEFEKLYNDEAQESLLTLFDGVCDSKKLFLLTSNKSKINEYFINRPSRIRYTKKFETIDKETLNDIIEDLLLDKEHKEEIERITEALGSAGKDLIISLIEEVNLTDKSPLEIIKLMNVKIPKLRYSYVALLKSGIEKFEGTYNNHPLAKEKLVFDRWYDSFEYSEYISAMQQEKIGDEIVLRDREGNKFKFYKEKEFNSIENIIA